MAPRPAASNEPRVRTPRTNVPVMNEQDSPKTQLAILKASLMATDPNHNDMRKLTKAILIKLSEIVLDSQE